MISFVYLPVLGMRILQPFVVWKTNQVIYIIYNLFSIQVLFITFFCSVMNIWLSHRYCLLLLYYSSHSEYLQDLITIFLFILMNFVWYFSYRITIHKFSSTFFNVIWDLWGRTLNSNLLDKTYFQKLSVHEILLQLKKIWWSDMMVRLHK